MAKRRERLRAQDIQGVWAIIPTPAKDNAGDWRASDTVDLDETARAAEALVAAGVDGILSLGTLGECATLDWEEKRAFMATLCETVRGRVPVFGGTSSLSTRETVRQTRAALDLGLDGTMIGPPMWSQADLTCAVQFYKDVAEAVPEMAICVYNNPWVFKFGFPPPFWAQVAQIPQVVCSKYAGVGALAIILNVVQGRIRLMPLDADYYAAARIDPEACTAFWASGAACGPAPVLELRDRVARADWSGARQITNELMATYQHLIPRGDFNEFSLYNIQLEKARMDAAGWMKAGPNRPPYTFTPQAYLEGAHKAGAMWAELQKRYAR